MKTPPFEGVCMATPPVRSNHLSIAFWSSNSDHFALWNCLNSDHRKHEKMLAWRLGLEEKSYWLLELCASRKAAIKLVAKGKGRWCLLVCEMWQWIQSPGAVCRPGPAGLGWQLWCHWFITVRGDQSRNWFCTDGSGFANKEFAHRDGDRPVPFPGKWARLSVRREQGHRWARYPKVMGDYSDSDGGPSGCYPLHMLLLIR